MPKTERALCRAVLRNQHLGSWRQRSLTQLQSALKSKLADAKAFVKDGRGDEEIQFTISKGSKVELDNLLGMLSERGVSGISPVKTVGTMGSVFGIPKIMGQAPAITVQVGPKGRC
jgi:hypothetical protein